jgi:hypothetical protein
MTLIASGENMSDQDLLAQAASVLDTYREVVG